MRLFSIFERSLVFNSFEVWQACKSIRWYSIWFVDLKTFEDNFLDISWEFSFELTPSYRNWKIILQLVLRFAMRVWSLTMKNFKDQNSKCPNICLWSVNIVNESLRWHIYWWPNVNIFKFRPSSFCEPKICNFGLSIMNENVRYFDISMYYPMITEIDKSFENSFNIRSSLIFFHVFFLS